MFLPSSTTKSPVETPKIMKRKQNSEAQFPGKLHDMMSYVKLYGLEHIISWTQNGTAIMIHDPTGLIQILPIFFSQTKYRSFRRQLNMWHFKRIMSGPFQGAFVHPFFIENKKFLCAYMSRHIDPSDIQPEPLSENISLSSFTCQPKIQEEKPAINFKQTSGEQQNSTIFFDSIPSSKPVDSLPQLRRSNYENPLYNLNSEFDSFAMVDEDSLFSIVSPINSLGMSSFKTTIEGDITSSGINDRATTRLAMLPSTDNSIFPMRRNESSNMMAPTRLALEETCPGMSIPADPESIESIFRELGEFNS